MCWRHRKPGWLEQRQVVGDAVRGRPGPGVQGLVVSFVCGLNAIGSHWEVLRKELL